MTVGQFKKDYPNVWDEFSQWFDKNGSGANGANDLTQKGFDIWFPLYVDNKMIKDVDEYENILGI